MKKYSLVSVRNATSIPTAFIGAICAIAFILPAQVFAAPLTRQLDLGMSNADVTSLQSFLAANSNYYPEGLITGYYGSLTAAAVSRFQTANGLDAVGRVGPLTITAINGQMGVVISVVNGDDSAPTIYPVTVFTSTNSATFSWSTNESAKSRVMYGNSWPFLYANAPSVSTNGYGIMSSVTLSGLQARSTYYYVLESVDGSGNVSLTVGKPFTTQ